MKNPEKKKKNIKKGVTIVNKTKVKAKSKVKESKEKIKEQHTVVKNTSKAKNTKKAENIEAIVIKEIEAEIVEPEIVEPEIVENEELPKKDEMTEFISIIEGALFASQVPLSLDSLARLFGEEIPKKKLIVEIKKAITQLQMDYQNRGIELVEVSTGFRFQVGKIATPFVAKVQEDKPARYSRALLETLALIAYRQPITRSEIEDIRGVVVSTHIIKTLDEHEWIRVVGHKDVPGKPALYATTKTFLDHFGLKSLEDLPPLAELKNFETLVVQSHENALSIDEINKLREADLRVSKIESIEANTEDSTNSVAESSDFMDEIPEFEEIDAQLAQRSETDAERILAEEIKLEEMA